MKAAQAVLPASDEATLPGTPPKALQAAWRALSSAEREALAAHLSGGTSSEWVADVLTRAGHPIAPTTVRSYRRSCAKKARDV